MRFNYLFDGDPQHLRELREGLEDWVGASAQYVDDLLIVTNELATNALIYGKPPILIAVVWEPALIRIRVTQSCQPEGNIPRLASLPGYRGRGLLLVNTLSQAWGWSSNGQNLAVWAELADPGNLSQ